MPSNTLYTARERFDSSFGDSWEKYLKFLGRHDLDRVVTLDTILCPSVIDVVAKEDWEALAPDSTSMDFFIDLDFVRRKSASALKPYNVLAVVKEPRAADLDTLQMPSFDFAGFDVVDKADEVSAILNCGGFPEVFSNAELLRSTGLISSIDRAYHIRDDLVRFNPDEHHADCNVWALWVATE